MAPSIDIDRYWETSDYLPAPDAIQALKEQLRMRIPAGQERDWVRPDLIDAVARDGEEDSTELHLTPDDLQEIEEAVAHFEVKGLPLNAMQAEHFPLRKLAVKLRERRLALPRDRPFFVIRGLTPGWYSKDKNVIIFLGLASHVGTKRAMFPGDPTVLHHVTNIQMSREEEETTYRGPGNRNIALPFHTDYGDIVSLFTISPAASGGAFYLADIHKIEARLRETRPDLLDLLRKDWHVTNPNLKQGYQIRPLLYSLPMNGLALQYIRNRVLDGVRLRPDITPPLTPKQMEAIDALQVVGREVAERFAFQKGDIVFFNNLRMMHARDEFVDGCDAENTPTRYVLRVILKDEKNTTWEVPPGMEEMWKHMYEHEDCEEIVSVKRELMAMNPSP